MGGGVTLGSSRVRDRMGGRHQPVGYRMCFACLHAYYTGNDDCIQRPQCGTASKYPTSQGNAEGLA